MHIVRFVDGTEPRYGVLGHNTPDDVITVVDGDPLFGAMRPLGRTVARDDVRLLAPVIPRSKVIGIGRNYRDHARELGNDVPDAPVLFVKPNTAVVGPDDPVIMPAFSQDVQFEGELAVVIAKMCKDIPQERVSEVIAGYTVGNDVTARDVQRSDSTWARAKGFDTSCPLGPVLVTDLDVRDLRLTTTVAGQVRQSASTADMVWSVPELVSYVSSVFTLLPGDVILTGTPAGVGAVDSGQVVEVTLDGIGTLRNPFLRR